METNENTLVLISVILMILKLTGVINWSWWFVAMPLIIPFVFAISLGLFYKVILSSINKKIKSITNEIQGD